MRKPQRVSEMYNSKLASTLSAIKSILEITKYIKLQVTSSSSFKFVTKCFFLLSFSSSNTKVHLERKNSLILKIYEISGK